MIYYIDVYFEDPLVRGYDELADLVYSKDSSTLFGESAGEYLVSFMVESNDMIKAIRQKIDLVKEWGLSPYKTTSEAEDATISKEAESILRGE